jgi:hypothetical protein
MEGMRMFEWMGFVILGFAAGLLATLLINHINSEDEIEKIEPQHIIREEKNIVIANAEFSIPKEDMLYPVSGKWLEGELSHKLAEEIWKYAYVSRTDDRRTGQFIYRARLQVVDMGQLNPFCSYGERREGE